jgi:hypothetical protein
VWLVEIEVEVEIEIEVEVVALEGTLLLEDDKSMNETLLQMTTDDTGGVSPTKSKVVPLEATKREEWDASHLLSLHPHLPTLFCNREAKIC